MPLLSGFIIIEGVTRFKSLSDGKVGYYVILRYLAAGLILFLLGYMLTNIIKIFLHSIYPSNPDTFLDHYLQKFINFIYYAWGLIRDPIQLISSGSTIPSSSIMSLLISAIWVTFSYIHRTRNPDYEAQIEEQLFRRESGIKGEILYDARDNREAVIVLLKSRKFYVGYISRIATNYKQKDHDVRLLPLNAGYMDESTLKIKYTSSYSNIWSIVKEISTSGKSFNKVSISYGNKSFELNKNEVKNIIHKFGIVFRWDDIDSVSYWLHFYSREKSNNSPDNPDNPDKSSRS